MLRLNYGQIGGTLFQAMSFEISSNELLYDFFFNFFSNICSGLQLKDHGWRLRNLERVHSGWNGSLRRRSLGFYSQGALHPILRHLLSVLTFHGTEINLSHHPSAYVKNR